MKKDLRQDVSAFAESVQFNSTIPRNNTITMDHPNLQLKVKYFYF